MEVEHHRCRLEAQGTGLAIVRRRSLQAIVKADGRKGNAAWLVRAPMLWLRKAPGTRVDRGDVHWHMPTTGA